MKTRLEFVLWLTLAVMCILVGPLKSCIHNAAGAELKQEDAEILFQLTGKLMKREVPDTRPHVVFTTHEKLMALACVKPCPSIKAYQRDDTVYVDEKLDVTDHYGASIVLHEFVHYYQWVKDGQAKDCQEWVNREIMAYHYQNEVLYRGGHQLTPVPSMPKCETK